MDLLSGDYNASVLESVDLCSYFMQSVSFASDNRE